MSYVLDALRKSEHERQRLSGKSSILYPAMVEQNRLIELWPAMLAGAVLTAIAISLLWWLWLRPPEITASSSAEKPVVAVAPQSSAVQMRESAAQQTPKPAVGKAAPLPSALLKRAAAPAAKKGATPAKAGDRPAQSAVAATTSQTEANADPLKDMPALVISGYMHDEQVGSMAIINDKLVHEGEEVAPGLRLEKIVGNSAILNYKGYQFRR